jgi:uncharacterized protein (DUF2267 family)
VAYSQVRRPSRASDSGARSIFAKENDVQYDELIEKVAERAGTDRETAQALTVATLQTLAERITGGEAEDLAAQLPEPLKRAIPERPAGTAEAFDLAEFERRVADRAALDQDSVEHHVRAVFRALREAVTEGEFDDVLAQLPNEYRAVTTAVA